MLSYRFEIAFCERLRAAPVDLAHVQAVGRVQAQRTAVPRGELAAQRIEEFLFSEQQRVIVEGDVARAERRLAVYLGESFGEGAAAVARP